MPQTMRYRGQLYWLALTTIVLSLVVAALLVVEFAQYRAIRQESEGGSDSITALAFHFEREYLLFQKELVKAAAAGDSKYDPEELQLRFDILSSRISLLRDSREITILEARPEYLEVMPHVEELMRTLEQVISIRPFRYKNLATAVKELDGIGLSVHALTLAAISETSKILETKERETLKKTAGIIAISFAMLLLLLGASYAFFIWHRNQESDRKKQAKLTDELRDLNDHLEAKVAERTMAQEKIALEAQEASGRTAVALSLVEATLEATNNGILVLNREGAITLTNQQFARLWRIPADLIALGDDSKILQFAVAQLKDPQPFLKQAKDINSRPTAISRETLVLADGRVFALFSHPQSLGDEILGRVWSFLDITEQVLAEERVLKLTQAVTHELEISERHRGQLQALLQALPEMVWMKDIDGVFLSCNAAFEAMIAAPASEIIGKTDYHFFPAEVADAFQRDDRAAGQSPTPVVLEEWVEHQGAGRRVLLETIKVGVRDVQGALMGILGVARDVTLMRALVADLEKAKEDAQKSNEAKSLFLANMSHEIRTPMNAIVGMADLALATDLSVRQRNHIAKIKTASDGLMHIIDDILDFSKIEAGKLQIENVPFELEEVFERLSSLMALRAESQGIELTYNVASGTPAVLVGDALRLGQILINLLSNAMKFSSGGNVVVEVHSIPLHDSLAELHFSVSDEGIGISDEQISQMFQPFIQADLSTTRRFGGTGLGLAISRHLVNLLGGRIWVESTVGVGSTFHFTAQFACSPDRRSQGVAQLSAQLATHSNQVILVIDDNPLARKLLAHLVSQLGLNAIALQSGQEAIDLLESADAPQVLACLVDWFMPEPNGIETITKIRAIYANRGSPCPPVILVTAHSQDNALRRVLHHTDGLLAKPVTARNFYEEMARCLGVSNALRARTGYRKVDDLQWSRFYALDVLLVEDMDINREVLSELLSGVGLQVRLATNGAEALAQVAQKIPDVILMDCHMPVMDGYTATRQLRANPVHSDISIIALTASAMADDRRQCLDAGMNAYVTKPVHLQDLYEQIVRCLPNASTVATPSNAPDQGDFSHVNAEVPKFRGIDSALGLAQVGGRIPLYLQVLKKFRDNLGPSFPIQFSDAIASENWCVAERLIHSLKSVSRTLGASALADAAVKLEASVASRNANAIAPLFVALSLQLDQVCRGLAAIDAEAAVHRASPTPIGAAEKEQLQRLQSLIVARDSEAAELVLEITEAMRQSPFGPQWSLLAREIERYEFAAAELLLNRFMEIIDCIP